MSTHWFEKEPESGSIYETYKGKDMNEQIMDVQNVRKAIHSALTSSKPQTDVEKLFVKSLCGYLGVLADMEMLLLAQKYGLMDQDTLSFNLGMAENRIHSMFEMPIPDEEADETDDDGTSVQVAAVKVSDKDIADVLDKINRFIGKKGE